MFDMAWSLKASVTARMAWVSSPGTIQKVLFSPPARCGSLARPGSPVARFSMASLMVFGGSIVVTVLTTLAAWVYVALRYLA